MSFNWTEYLTLAQELTGQSTSSSIQEACLRAAISRAYYAAFCNARNFLKNKDGYLSPNTGSVHKDIIERFEFSNDATRRYVGSLLRSLRSIRTIVDYDAVFRGDQLSRTRGALIKAAEVIQVLATM